VPAIMAAASATNSIKVGCRVFCTSYRPAGVLAKEAMTIDFLTEGRLELGLGAGWVTSEYEALGIPFDPPGKRITRLEETIAVVKAHMKGEDLNFNGDQVKASGYQGLPASPSGKVPLMIGGGAPRILGIAGREADIVSINYNNSSGHLAGSRETDTAEATLKKIEWIKEGAGNRFDDIELEIGAYLTIVTDNQTETAKSFTDMLGMSVEEVLSFPHALIGSVDYICEELEKRRELFGIPYISFPDSAAESAIPIVEKLSGK
ncbi:MAG: TIGR03621 family F420-dependent LLM class oxidoreductase, partial [SAR86 cluster bacterium]|nr:TIGR03621 family F420-dependent LLM class oxidoreductase [SAR86 cluster bacterium]